MTSRLSDFTISRCNNVHTIHEVLYIACIGMYIRYFETKTQGGIREKIFDIDQTTPTLFFFLFLFLLRPVLFSK